MPSTIKHLTVEQVRERIADRCFSPTTDVRFGVEVEFLTIPHHPLRARIDADTIQALVPPLPNGSRLSVEPGGQVELSSLPGSSVGAVADAIASDLDVVRRTMHEAGFKLVGLGLDPTRSPKRVTTQPRYAAMEAYFDVVSPAARLMMANTAAIHVNVQVPGDASRRWELAHRLGPVLLAAFANSPLDIGGPTGWASSRARAWSEVDASRSRPAANGSSARDAWTDYALDANVMLIADGQRATPVTDPMSLRAWIDGGHALGYPTDDDVGYHLTTLFPPVRPRGWLELRMIDALPDPWWRVPLAVAGALLSDDEAADRALDATASTAGCWTEAARDGLRHPGLLSAAARCFEVAASALDRVGADPLTRSALSAYRDRYIARGRTPSDDRLDAWHEGHLLPTDDALEVA